MKPQIDLFDPVYLAFHDCFHADAEKPARPKRKRISLKKAKNVEVSNESELDSLLPYLFPEDYPELQEQIDSINITWTSDDIDLLQQEILRSSINVLLDYRSGTQSRNEAYAWLMNDDVAPFSYRVCIRSMGGRAETFRSHVCSRLHSERRLLRQAQVLTERQSAYLDWINKLVIPEGFDKLTGIELLAWLDQLDEINQQVASKSGY